MAEKPRLPFGALIDDRLTAAFERNLSHAARVDRPDRVDVDVWERYVAGQPWVLLNVGIMGLQLQRRETTEVLREASRLFFERRSNYWLVAELIASRGSLEPHTAFGEPVYEAAIQTVQSAVAAKLGSRANDTDRSYPGLSMEAVSLIFCAIAKNSSAFRPRDARQLPDMDQTVIAQLVRGVRSADRDMDRRLANLRAIAGRSFGDRANLASLRSLIWGAIAGSTVAQGEQDEGYALMGVEPVLDPVTLATGLLILREGDLYESAVAPRGDLQLGARLRPRGWDDDVDLSAGIEAYVRYVSTLTQGP